MSDPVAVAWISRRCFRCHSVFVVLIIVAVLFVVVFVIVVLVVVVLIVVVLVVIFLVVICLVIFISNYYEWLADPNRHPDVL